MRAGPRESREAPGSVLIIRKMAEESWYLEKTVSWGKRFKALNGTLIRHPSFQLPLVMLLLYYRPCSTCRPTINHFLRLFTDCPAPLALASFSQLRQTTRRGPFDSVRHHTRLS